MNDYLFINGVSIDDDTPYICHWDSTRWGRVEAREPVTTATASGVFTVFPLATAYGVRKGKVTIYAATLDVFDKQRTLSEMKGLLSGSKIVHLGSRQLSVYFYGADEVENESVNAATIGGVSSDFVATDPFWRLNQPLRGIYTPVTPGPEWSLYDDRTVPARIPPYEFSEASFTLSNWGTAFAWGAGAIAGGSPGATVYMRGPGASRVAVLLDDDGAGSFSEADAFLLEVGDNAIRVEQADGSLVTPGEAFTVSFGDTYMRFF